MAIATTNGPTLTGLPRNPNSRAPRPRSSQNPLPVVL